MKTIRFILQFRFNHQLSMTEIARAVRVSQGTVHIIPSCARGAGLDAGPCRRVSTTLRCAGRCIRRPSAGPG